MRYALQIISLVLLGAGVVTLFCAAGVLEAAGFASAIKLGIGGTVLCLPYIIIVR